MEHWCPACDKSSVEEEGEFYNLAWTCNACIIEFKKPQLLPGDVAAEGFKQIRESLETNNDNSINDGRGITVRE